MTKAATRLLSGGAFRPTVYYSEPNRFENPDGSNQVLNDQGEDIVGKALKVHHYGYVAFRGRA
jgi:hypothetical protein